MTIDELRKRIDEIDREIVRLIGKRLEMVQRIAEVKNAEGRGISDDERELMVKMNWRRLAVEYGIPVDIISILADLLIKYSKSLQINLRGRKKLQKRVTFIGYGNMASVLARQLVKVGHEVVITGRNLDKAEELAKILGCRYMDLESAIEFGEYIVLALSFEAYKNGYVNKLFVHLRNKVAMDILSSKSWVFHYLEGESLQNNFMYVSVHPLFGPLTPPIGEKIAIIPSKTGATVLQDVVDLWFSAGLEPVVVDLEEHEKAMAIVQVLTHLYLTAFSKALKKLSQELHIYPDKLSTPTYREVRTIVERLKHIESVIFEIQKTNPFSVFVRKEAVDVLKDVIESIGRQV